MKKIVSLILVLLMLACAVMPVGAAQQEDKVYDGDPVVVVRGIAFASLINRDGTAALKVEMGDIVPVLFESLLARFALKDKEAFGDAFCEVAYDILEPISCDKEGNSKYDIYMRQYNKSMADHKSFANNLSNEAEHGLLKSAIARFGAENVYYFSYDWRKSPYELAQELKALIETAKSDHNTDKVDIISASMGCMVTSGYFYYCGTDSVDSSVFVSGAHNGTYSFGNGINGDLILDSDVILSYIYEMTQGDIFVNLILKVFDILGAVDYLVDFANDFIQTNYDKTNDRVLRDCLGTMPGFWAICPDECYDSGIQKIFAGHEQDYPVLLEKLAETRNYVFSTEKILKDAVANGVKQTFVSNYNSTLAPLYKDADLNGDSVLETVFTSNFATVAKLGETLGEEDIQGVPAEYISADKVVNASTAVFPKTTWFVKDATHVATDYASPYSDFVLTLLESETQPTVYTFSEYPRFMIRNADATLSPLK